MNFLISGATGFIGQQLVARLKAEHCVKVLSRDRIHAERLLGVPAYDWNYRLDPVPTEALEDVQVIIHLMGENLGNGRWTEQRKQEIYQSRILSTRKLVEAVALDERYQGPINAVSPNPVQYQEFSETLGNVLHRPIFLTIPAFILKLALGEAAVLALNSYRIEPTKLIRSYDFHFKFIQISTALENIIQKTSLKLN
ncbi:MAG: DUF1731 domain-containing protein [Nitrosomonas sp.]|nr:DUF1731 domain-containing protein [Nitrosomonas sp.]MBK7365751.1 DUF1731 domain-containing protein [Nitrosomonas sp.]